MAHKEIQSNLKSGVAVPPEQVATETVVSAWISMEQLHSILFLLTVGAYTAAVTAKVEQDKLGAGADAKDVSGATASIGAASALHLIEVSGRELDVAGGFKYVRLSLTAAGAGAIVGACYIGKPARYLP